MRAPRVDKPRLVAAPRRGAGLLASAVAAIALAAWIVVGGFVDPAPARGPGPSAAAADKRELAQDVERELLECTNLRREKHGLKPMRIATALKRAARFHAKNMARKGFFGHTDHKGRSPAERVAMFRPKVRLRWKGENIAAGYGSASAACSAWMGSSSHRVHMLGPYNRIGLGFWSGGYYGTYFVQEFGSSR